MAANQFRLSIGAKRQVTLPAELLQQLQVPDRSDLFVEVINGHAVLTPMVTIPRAQLPETLRQTIQSRRGALNSDIPLAQLLQEIDFSGTPAPPAAPPLSQQSRLANLTPNEKQALAQAAHPSEAIEEDPEASMQETYLVR
jgi:antitoxin component of MazEF toxin-antitoxin module